MQIRKKKSHLQEFKTASIFIKAKLNADICLFKGFRPENLLKDIQVFDIREVCFNSFFRSSGVKTGI